MERKEFYVDHFKEARDKEFPGETHYPFFQIGEGDVGGTQSWDQDSNDNYFSHHVISNQNDFPALSLYILDHLKKPTSLRNTYQIKFSEDASLVVGETGKKVLEGILDLHNDLITPRRS